MNGSFLITRPEHDITTRYLSKWSEEIIEKANKKGLSIIDLRRNKAIRERFIGTLKKVNPQLVCLNGHGDKDSVRGHENEIILKDGDEKSIKCKIIFARACKSAKALGIKVASASSGVSAFLGYKEDFWFKFNPEKLSNPLKDKTAALCLKPSNHLMISLLKGHQVEDANKKSKKLFKKNIEKLLIKGPSTEDYDCINILYWDMIHQICLGDKNTTIN